jgi:hypothetical protein
MSIVRQLCDCLKEINTKACVVCKIPINAKTTICYILPCGLVENLHAIWRERITDIHCWENVKCHIKNTAGAATCVLHIDMYSSCFRLSLRVVPSGCNKVCGGYVQRLYTLCSAV